MSLVQVKQNNGKVFTFDYSPEKSIDSFKADIYAKTNIPIEQQKIVFKGTELLTGKALGDYNVKENSIINLLLKNIS